MNEDVWLPLVDEPLGEIIDGIQAEDTQITSLIGSPRRQLAFRTFAYLRVGILLGRLLEDPDVHAAVLKEVRDVASEVASDPRLAFDDALGPDEAAVERFREFARRLED